MNGSTRLWLAYKVNSRLAISPEFCDMLYSKNLRSVDFALADAIFEFSRRIRRNLSLSSILNLTAVDTRTPRKDRPCMGKQGYVVFVIGIFRLSTHLGFYELPL